MIVTLKGQAQNSQSSAAGTYVLEPKPENGKSHWLQYNGSNAIWYNSKYGGWTIGPQDDLGTSDEALIYSGDDVAGPQVATTWQYFDGALDMWITSKNILVDTFVEKGTYK